MNKKKSNEPSLQLTIFLAEIEGCYSSMLGGHAMRSLPQWILAALVIIVTVGSASATCVDGRPEPCLGTLQTPPILTPPLLLSGPDLKAVAPAPQIQTFTLAMPPAVAASVQLYIAATPSPSQQLLQLRRRAAAIQAKIGDEGYQVAFKQLKTILSIARGGSSTPSTYAEDHLRNAQRLLGEYLLVLREIESITLGIRIGGENYDQRVAQLEIVQGHIDAVNVNLSPLYSVHRSNATVHIEDPNPPRTPNCRTETVYESHIVNVMVSAGFDNRGNPIMRQGRDIERRPKEITVCD